MDLVITEVSHTSPDTQGASDDRRVVLVVAGSSISAAAARLLDTGREALRRDGCTGLVIDLAEVTFVDSTGIGAFVELASDADSHGATFEIRSPSARVHRLLEVTGLADTWAEGAGSDE